MPNRWGRDGFELRDHLLCSDTGLTARQLSWRAHCGAALARYEEPNDEGQDWTAPTFLRHWHNVVVPSVQPA